jgi:DNA-binding CsgD family transcriptional regulator
MSELCIGQLQRGRESFERREWRHAYDALRSLDEAGALETDDLERLATAAYLVGEDLVFQKLTERLHRVHVEAGCAERAARSAFWLAITSLLRGDVGQANAWTGRGDRLVQELDCAERGYLLLPGAEQLLQSGDAASAHATSTQAAGIAEHCREYDLIVLARHVQGRSLIQLGQVASGLKLLDEIMLAVVAGELSPIVTGLMYCSVIEACREVLELRRAREWTLALSRWCEQQVEMVAFSDTCLVHRAEIMQFHGAWLEAFAEVSRACERCERAERRPPGAALYQRAEIHRLRGQTSEAEQGYREASRLGWEPQPGLALLRLAQGRTDAAAATIRRLMSATSGRTQRMRLLPASFEIMLTAGDLEEACRACEELEALKEVLGTDVLGALAAQARGALSLRQQDARGAMGPLRYAFNLWHRVGAPYEAARVRVLIGQTCRELGDEEAATLEFDAARSAFEQLGARPEITHIDSLRPSSTPASALTARELEVLRLIASGRTNKGIARKLGVSERTIDRHVSSILTKLDVPSRAAATAYAYSHQIF